MRQLEEWWHNDIARATEESNADRLRSLVKQATDNARRADKYEPERAPRWRAIAERAQSALDG